MSLNSTSNDVMTAGPLDSDQLNLEEETIEDLTEKDVPEKDITEAIARRSSYLLNSDEIDHHASPNPSDDTLERLRNNMVITNRQPNKLAVDEIALIKQFHKFWGWIGYFSSIVVILLIDLPFIIFTCLMHPESGAKRQADVNALLAEVNEIAEVIHLNLTNSSLTEKQQEILDSVNVSDVENLYNHAREENAEYAKDMDALLLCWIIVGVIHFAIFLCFMSYSVYHRNHLVIKSKSKQFLVQIIISVPGSIITTTLHKAYALNAWQYEEKAYNSAVGFVLICLVYFFLQMFLSALTCRMRLIYVVFNSNAELHAGLFFKPVPIHIIMYLFSICFLIPYYFVDNTMFLVNGFDFVAVPTFFVMIVIYPLWILYYTYKSRKLHISNLHFDFYTNIRVVVYFSIVGFIALMFLCIMPDSIASISLLVFGAQTSTILYFAELVYCLSFIRHKEKSLEKQQKQAHTGLNEMVSDNGSARPCDSPIIISTGREKTNRAPITINHL